MLFVLDGVGLCTGVVLTDGVELCVDGDETDELTELELDPADVLAGGVFLTLGFAGGACSVGTAPALVNGVMAGCCELAEADWASDPVGAAGADVFLIADPMANAATSPTTNASASSSQRLRTS